ncbi:MAG: NAD-dependent epimerase/dehydratase family protein [Nitrospinaceae bacterium]
MNAPVPLDGSPVLVTGASGFIGSHLVDALRKRGCRVHCLIRSTSSRRWLPPEGIVPHIADLTHAPSLDSCMDEVEHVFHCAGLTRARTRQEFYAANAEACRVLFDACRRHRHRLKSIVHLSSLAAAGPAAPDLPVDETTPCRPITHYGASKLAGEKIALEYAAELPLVVLRPPVVYGEREENFLKYLRLLHRGWQLQVGRGSRFLSLIYVHDLVEAMLRAASGAGESPGVYFVTDGRVYSWEDVGKTAASILAVQPRTLVLPEGIVNALSMVAQGWAGLRREAPILDRHEVRNLKQRAWTASPQKFFDAFQFQPRFGLEQGLTATLNWDRQNNWL